MSEPTATQVEIFTNDYIAAMMWASQDDDGPLDRYDVSQIVGEALEQIQMECYAFCKAHAADIETWEGADAYGQAGYDFWMTRVGHGVGFWDGDWPEESGERLNVAAKAAGNRDLYVGQYESIHYTCS